MDFEDYMDPVVMGFTLVVWLIVMVLIFKGMFMAGDSSQYLKYQITMAVIMLPITWFFIERSVHR